MVNFVWYKINFLSELRINFMHYFMTTQLFKANTRGTADFGWLKANFSFFWQLFQSRACTIRKIACFK
jgi:hypothetical protein